MRQEDIVDDFSPMNECRMIWANQANNHSFHSVIKHIRDTLNNYVAT